MSPIAYLPFFYFQNTRLNNRKAFVFHAAYEWLPAALLAFYYFSSASTLVSVILYYLAFISVYEIGYVINDQQAHEEKEGRKRSEQLNAFQLTTFIAIRLIVFLIITTLQSQMQSTLWWGWYLLLAIQFAWHNLLTLRSLKAVTFSFLAFSRFFSPIIMLIPTAISASLALPVFLNYVLFRLFTYLDSKDLLRNFERKSGAYYRGYYLLIIPFSILIAYLYQSWIPLALNGYYLLIGLAFSLLPSSAKATSD
ncbi:MAG: hypothetical protein HYZ44_12695 [Bacteroidetes bacterium]|nr:hypothetical protein [Bacteroidota bacterium]